MDNRNGAIRYLRPTFHDCDVTFAKFQAVAFTLRQVPL